jgi:hypothetical protein
MELIANESRPMTNRSPTFLVMPVRGIHPGYNDRGVHQDHGRVFRNNSSPEQ